MATITIDCNGLRLRTERRARVPPVNRRPLWLAGLVAIAALATLYAAPLASGFLNDDLFFLEDAAQRPLAETLRGLDVLGNYYRPLSRQVYFAALGPIGGGLPWVFHACNFTLFLAALALLADALRVLLPRAGVMAGVLYFAVLPFQRVNLTWISCSQDLLALGLALGALALHRRDRAAPAVLCYVLAMAGKESAWPLPLALAAWDAAVARRTPRAVLRRAIPFVIAGAVWIALVLSLRAAHPRAADFLRFEPPAFVAAHVHMLQAFAGLDHPAGLAAGLMRRGPDLLSLLLAGALAWWIGAGATQARNDAGARAVIGFALPWMLAFGLAIGPVAHTWSSYYYTLAAVGAAALVGLACARIGRPGWLALCAGLLWLHAGSSATRAFAMKNDPWEWTSHLTAFYLERAGAVTRTLTRWQLEHAPAPPAGSRFFYALLPPWAGFQMGNGPLLRRLYADPTLESYHYSQFSEATAGDRPVYFLYWDGAALEPLYGNHPQRLFLVGCDLLLLDRPAGAAHAFHRGLAAGEDPLDHLYWLGWAELWAGDRDRAEAAWRAFGARDDSTGWIQSLAAAREALLVRGDSLEARRRLLDTIRLGIGRPEGHAALGDLMWARRSRYGLLELKVATRLDPADWRSRRDLFMGLVAARLDAPARTALEELQALYPEWNSDPALRQSVETLEARGGAPDEARSGKPRP
jgi:hypothetical protein